MSNTRADEFKETTNPATQYVSWASNDKAFRFYDKAKKTKSAKPLPTTFILLARASAVKGWSDEFKAGIYSNIVTNIGGEELRVRAGKQQIAQGLYADIKAEIKSAGGHYEAKIFALCEGEIIMIEFKGAALWEWGEFVKKHKESKALLKHEIVIKKHKNGEKGAVKFTTPVFELGAKLDLEKVTASNIAYTKSKEYLVNCKTQSQTFAESEATPLPDLPENSGADGDDEEDDLPF